MAELEDADGINTVGNGIGHDLSLCIDGSAVLTYNLNDYYTPVAGDYTRGERYTFLCPNSLRVNIRCRSVPGIC